MTAIYLVCSILTQNAVVQAFYSQKVRLEPAVFMYGIKQNPWDYVRIKARRCLVRLGFLEQSQKNVISWKWQRPLELHAIALCNSITSIMHDWSKSFQTISTQFSFVYVNQSKNLDDKTNIDIATNILVLIDNGMNNIHQTPDFL